MTKSIDIKKTKRLKGVSLFSSAGIGEAYFDEIGIDIIVANELISDRAKLYTAQHQNTKMVEGDILEQEVFDKIVQLSGKIDFLLATPPCQGMSVAGKNRDFETMLDDMRNYLVFKIIDFINLKKPSYVLIENVPNFLKLKLPFNGELHTLIEILTLLYSDEYVIDSKILDSSEYGVPQKRTRALVKMYKKGLNWDWPKKNKKKVTVKEAIGHLPSLESGQSSNIPWHFARIHSPKHIEWMRHTPTGKSAFENENYFPVKPNGDRIKSYMTTYRRIKWDEPSPTITMRNDAISSQLNVHPGRKLPDGTYSDARVLTPLELMIIDSLPRNWSIPATTPEILVRQCIGESVPPLLLKKVLEGIVDHDL